MSTLSKPVIGRFFLLLLGIALSASGQTFVPCGIKSCNTKYENCNNGICECKLGYGGSNCDKDLNECVDLDPNACSFPGGYCVNHSPSGNRYSCGCDTRMGRWRVGNETDEHGPTTCEDVNECFGRQTPCHDLATCENTPGSFQCTCLDGYAGDGVNSCTLIPEVVLTTCANLDCNMITSYCDEVGETPKCRCNDGYIQFNGKGKCHDTNECANRKNNNCHRFAECVNTPGSYHCVCMEGSNDVSREINGTRCQSINECKDGTHNCSGEGICINRNPPEKFECVLPPSSSPTISPDPTNISSETPSLAVSSFPSIVPSAIATAIPTKSSPPSLEPNSLALSSLPSDSPSGIATKSSLPSLEPSENPSSVAFLVGGRTNETYTAPTAEGMI